MPLDLIINPEWAPNKLIIQRKLKYSSRETKMKKRNLDENEEKITKQKREFCRF